MVVPFLAPPIKIGALIVEKKHVAFQLIYVKSGRRWPKILVIDKSTEWSESS